MKRDALKVFNIIVPRNNKTTEKMQKDKRKVRVAICLHMGGMCLKKPIVLKTDWDRWNMASLIKTSTWGRG